MILHYEWDIDEWTCDEWDYEVDDKKVLEVIAEYYMNETKKKLGSKYDKETARVIANMMLEDFENFNEFEEYAKEYEYVVDYFEGDAIEQFKEYYSNRF